MLNQARRAVPTKNGFGRAVLHQLWGPDRGEASDTAQAACHTLALAGAAADTDRIVLQYPEKHYAFWKAELVEFVHLFGPGGFAENLSTSGLDENEVCIGDTIRLGSALLQVSEPVEPGFLLNARFNHPSIARMICESKRTGWHYRIVEHGQFQVGDELVIMERPHPEWPIARVLHFLHQETANRQALEELLKLKPLGRVTRELFQRRFDDLKPEFDQLDALPVRPVAEPEILSPVERSGNDVWRSVLVRGIMIESPAVRSFYLVSAQGGRLPKSKPGAHLKVKLPNGLTRHYSLCSNSLGDEYHIAVGRNPDSAGGSACLHEQVKVGDILHITDPINTFPVDAETEHHILIAGGIGITPFLSMIDYFERSFISYELHFCTRSAKDTPFYRRLSCLPANRITFHHSSGDLRNRIDLNAVLSDLDPDAHIYCCGPTGLMRAVEGATSKFDRKRVHFESFGAAATAQNAFSVKLESSGQVFLVGPDQTILQVLRDNHVDVDSQCESGSCGTCIVKYSQGEVLHKDFVLTADERKSCLTVCVSRAASDHLTLTL
ncbi:MOSC domain-containing protein [Mesorhizobium sp. M7A.F.Ca.US.006.01.1.1]|uniref:MOSC domain-containing protein n=1 Tax=Mesorhizobium sp. M7A.F.Ca.US.006.01.1.1 TaxID=2496707 RepID=UPI0013E2AAAD|nr:MOSC domain-containing protein [Mesorhizobium sp. M7A.F.Ca.US.006.01.1.1]